MAPRQTNKGSAAGAPSPPTHMPATTPAQFSTDYNFTLQAVMEMNKSLGQLQKSVEALEAAVNDQGRKLNVISHWITAVSAVVMTFGGIAYFFLDKMWEKIATIIDAIQHAS